MNMQYQSYKRVHKKLSKGFSLVELMVSLTIFALVMTVSVGTLLVVIDANAKAQALYSVMTNLSFAVDSITRNMRMGYDHYCDSNLHEPPQPLQTGQKDCGPNDTEIAFTRQADNVRVGYRFQGDAMTTGWIEQREGTGEWLRITAEDVVITTFRPVVRGSSSGDTSQPEISFLIQGYVKNGLDTDTDFTLQSHIVQRILNY